VSDLPILDRARLELTTRGDAALAVDFLGALFEEANELIQRLSTLIGGNDRLAVADVAHTLNGMAAALGAMRLRAAAATLEAQPEPATWPEGVERLRAALAELHAFVNP
jgi:HPt (histidine-containing phosphotransfer) domain-containing protein